MVCGHAAELNVSGNYLFWMTELLQDLTWDSSWRNGVFGLLKSKKHMQQRQASVSKLILTKGILFFFQTTKGIYLKNKTH